MNFSIGFQAPSNQELWSGFADKLIDENTEILFIELKHPNAPFASLS